MPYRVRAGHRPGVSVEVRDGQAGKPRPFITGASTEARRPVGGGAVMIGARQDRMTALAASVEVYICLYMSY